jgi:hypothetical protein
MSVLDLKLTNSHQAILDAVARLGGVRVPLEPLYLEAKVDFLFKERLRALVSARHLKQEYIDSHMVYSLFAEKTPAPVPVGNDNGNGNEP